MLQEPSRSWLHLQMTRLVCVQASFDGPETRIHGRLKAKTLHPKSAKIQWFDQSSTRKTKHAKCACPNANNREKRSDEQFQSLKIKIEPSNDRYLWLSVQSLNQKSLNELHFHGRTKLSSNGNPFTVQPLNLQIFFIYYQNIFI